jgi:hypothetical protein
MKQILHLFSLILLVSLSCEKDPPAPVEEEKDTSEIRIFPTYNGQNIKIDSIYTMPDAHRIIFTDIKFYAHRWKNGDVKLAEVALFDFKEKGSAFISTQQKYSSFTNLTGSIGVEEDVNHDDPTAFSTSSPLYIMNAGGMHWGWNPGYIFVKIEARVDTTANGTDDFNHILVYHAGTDDFLRSVSFSNVPWKKITDKKYRASMALNFNTFFENASSPINIKTEYLTHTAPDQVALTEKVVTNFVESLTFIP